MTDIVKEVKQADKRIRRHIRKTYLEHSASYSEKTGADVFFKLENLQHTGSFKARGALNKILSLSEKERARGVVTASSGNHGAAISFALSQIDCKGIVFLPENASPAKIDAIGRLGAEIRFHGTDSGKTELAAIEFAGKNNRTWVSPYNDAAIIGGQGTIGIELAEQHERLDAVFIAVGGGGLISGVSAYLKSVWPDVKMIGVSPENSAVMMKSVAAGQILDIPSLDTLSDGSAGGIEPGTITFPLACDLVDQWVSVTEDEIATELRDFIGLHHQMIEGAAAAAIAGFTKTAQQWRGQSVAIVICGANISHEKLVKVLAPE